MRGKEGRLVTVVILPRFLAFYPKIESQFDIKKVPLMSEAHHKPWKHCKCLSPNQMVEGFCAAS